MKFSIVIPLFNEAENINQLNLEILEAIKQLQNNNHEFEIIYVDDSSTDNTLETLKINNNVKTKILKNHPNLAQSKSILNGIDISNNNNIILLDGDLQNDPKDIIKMINVYNENENILVHGFRKTEMTHILPKILPENSKFYCQKIYNSKILDHGCSIKNF